MKRIIPVVITLFYLFLEAAPAQAQIPIRYGVAGGLQWSTIRGGLATPGSVTRIHLGGIAEATLTETFAIRVQPQLSLKGATLTGIFKEKLTYFELPIWGVYTYETGSGKLMGGLGPYFSLLAGGNIDGDKLQVGTDARAFDAGVSVLGSFEPAETNLAFSLFYNWGLTSISPPNPYDIKATNRTFGISIGYFLGER